MPLYHFSEDPGIEEFFPHRAKTSTSDERLVWAIDDWHAPTYCLPRDCPRACFWATDTTTAYDRDRWLTGGDTRMVIAVEAGWLERIRATVLYRYAMPEASFVSLDATAGHYVSRTAVKPTQVSAVGDLLDAIVVSGVELRLQPTLGTLWQRVTASTLAYSGTRLRNARGWPFRANVAGTGTVCSHVDD
jgi:hypothetical protein